ncbi:MAG: Asd/ArgC dimerization domain-containing protein [Candidatus Aenigmarchaeota archaeon]|nr:Asd/ArgC dimerization domain-containing protein [Candidatus Aenigmarchaeota archaeon]
MKRIGIYGATGNVGLEAIESLLNHQWFEISHLYASERSAGKRYMDACPLDVSHLPRSISEIVVEPTDMKNIPTDIDIAFFALAEDIAKEYERKYAPEFAKSLAVITTSSALRMDPRIPLIITEVNADHARLSEYNKIKIFPQCNCTAVPLTMALKPLQYTVGIEMVFMDSYQSVSGAGAGAVRNWAVERAKSELGKMPEPFPSGIGENPEVVYEGNVRPIGERDSRDEEKKVVEETLKMLGEYKDGKIVPADFQLDCMCNRVPTLRGHFEHIRVKPKKSCTAEDILSIYQEFNERSKELYGGLPSSPEQALVILDRQPQVRYDVSIGKGMSTVIGEIEIKDGWIRLRALSDNLRKGAAKGSVQVMEYLLREGYI